MRYFLLVLTLFSCSFAIDVLAADSCTVLLDNTTNQIIRAEGSCEKQYSPASTFKVALALMGYDAGVLIDEHEPAWPFKEGYIVNKDNDKQTTDPTSWEKNSVVWYSQKLAVALGAEKFERYINQFEYGNKDISGDKGKNNGLTHSWLSSSLRISPIEQVLFMNKILNRQLGLSPRAYDMTEAVLPIFEADGWAVKGKTGSGWLLDEEGKVDKNHPHGWFVGWAQKADRKIVFAKLMVDDEPVKGLNAFGLKAREAFLVELPHLVE